MHQLNWAILTRSFNPTDAKALLSNIRVHCLGGLEASGTKLGRADYGLIPRILQLDRKGCHIIVPETIVLKRTKPLTGCSAMCV
jgi:hypothetical protein